MGAIEELQRDCGYCRQPITLKWKSGPMPSEGVCLVVDELRHVLGYDVSINAQTKRCPEVAGHLLLDHDLAQHSLLQGIAPVPTPLEPGRARTITAGDDSSGHK